MLRRAILLWRRNDGQVLDIAPAEDNPIVDRVRAGDLLAGIVLASLGAVALHILQRNCRGLAVDFNQGAFVSEHLSAGCPRRAEVEEREPDLALADQRNTTANVFAHRGGSATRATRREEVVF